MTTGMIVCAQGDPQCYQAGCSHAAYAPVRLCDRPLGQHLQRLDVREPRPGPLALAETTAWAISRRKNRRGWHCETP